MKERKLGDRINRGFTGLVIILGMSMIIIGAYKAANYHPEYQEPPVEETNPLDTADIPILIPDSGLFSYAWIEASHWYNMSPFDLTYKEYRWYYNILNPENGECIAEVAFNLDIPFNQVTQVQFNARYLKP